MERLGPKVAKALGAGKGGGRPGLFQGKAPSLDGLDAAKALLLAELPQVLPRATALLRMEVSCTVLHCACFLLAAHCCSSWFSEVPALLQACASATADWRPQSWRHASPGKLLLRRSTSVKGSLMFM